MLKKLYVNVICVCMTIVLTSPWGKCFTHKTWEKYRESDLFELRAKELGHLEAARMFSYNEFIYFRKKVWKDVKFLASIFPWPYTVLRELEEQDSLYKTVVTLQYP